MRNELAMRIRAEPSPSGRGTATFWGTLVGCVCLGFLLGKWHAAQADPLSTLDYPAADAAGSYAAPKETEEARAALPGLPELRLEMQAHDYAAMLKDRAETIARGHVASDLKQERPALVGLAKDAASVRIKGDHLDHMLGEQFSLRVSLEQATFQGLKSFSIQTPSTRAYLWEWFAHQCARREGVLAPRSMFVRGNIQGQERGIYFLEEHFTKELLESQERREGPIVKFAEDAFWMLFHLARFDSEEMITVSPDLQGSMVDAFGKGRLAKSHALSKQLSDAIDRLSGLRDAAIQARQDGHFGGDAIHELELATAAWVEDLVDVRIAARVHALMSLLQAHHGLSRNNLRFYYDPVAAKLEPILYDCSPMNALYGLGAVGFSRQLHQKNAIVRSYRTSALYRESLALEVARMVAPGYLEALIEELSPELRELEQQLVHERNLPREMRVDRMINQLYGSRTELRKSLYPEFPLGAVSVQRVPENGAGMLEIEVWSTTEIPIVVDSFEFDNGVLVEALPLAETPQPSLGGGALILDAGRRWRFHLPADSRLSELVKIRDQLGDKAQASQEAPSRGLALSMRWRFASESKLRSLPLQSRVEQESWWRSGSRPQSPSLSQALAQHPFLAWDALEDQLMILPGSWDVQGDLVLPEGHILHAAGGVELRFEPSALMLSHNALRFEGTLDAPIRLGPIDKARGWLGVAVLNADEHSSWEHVWVSGASAIERAGWVTSGGVTFYRSPLVMRDGGFQDARGEDALNLFGTHAKLVGVRFDTSASDALDADFVTLRVERCYFESMAADAIDTSGSQGTIVDCHFKDIGDKCVSAGEQSVIEIHGGRVEGAAIGVASKDLSTVKIEGLALLGIRNFELCAYRKKAAFGPASIEALDLTIEVALPRLLAQTHSSITLDGEQVEVRDFDPKELYSSGLLGN